MAIDYQDWLQPVVITNASLTVVASGTVAISGTVPVTISNTPAVTISGTVSVAITSGSVSITGGTIDVGTINAGNVQITPGVFTLGGNGVKKVGVTGTAVQLHSSLTVKVVMVKARRANVGTVYLGTSTVTNDETAATGGLQLDPGDIVAFTDTDLAHIWLNGAAADGVSFAYWT